MYIAHLRNGKNRGVSGLQPLTRADADADLKGRVQVPKTRGYEFLKRRVRVPKKGGCEFEVPKK